MRRNNDEVTIENARVVFRNFAGKAGMYNREGDRFFSVFLDDEIAEQLLADGWNVKRLKPREDNEIGQAHLQIKVKYSENARPPRVVLITSRGRNDLDEETIEMLDWADFENVDLKFRPYNWEISGKTGVTAYLKSMYVKIYEDDLDRKYAEVTTSDDIPARAGRIDD